MSGRSCGRAFWVALVFLLLSVFATPARADSTQVVLVRSSRPTPSATAIFNRSRGELTADGFRVLLTDAVVRGDRSPTLTRIGSATGDPVMAGLFVEGDANAIEIRLVNVMTGQVLVRRVESELDAPDLPPEILARRAVDTLRASLLDFLFEGLRSAATIRRATPEPPWVKAPPAEPPPRWAVEGGLGSLLNFDRVDPAVLPVARLRFALDPWFQLRGTAAWGGTESQVDSARGSARVTQGVALFEGLFELSHGPWFRSHASLGGGAYYVSVTGNGSDAFPSQNTSTWAAAAAIGCGTSIPLGPHFELVLEAHALVTEPGIAVRFIDTNAGTLGRPTLLTSLTLAGWI